MHRSLIHILVSAALLAPAPLWAAGRLREETPKGSTDRYQLCTDLVREDAAAAYAQALAWKNGGAVADHCAALALVQLKRYDEAAHTLDALGGDVAIGDGARRAQLLDQAGNVWLLARQPQNASRSFSNALALKPRDANILSDRARAAAMAKNWTGADADLSAALAQDGDRADLLVLRASARHALGRKPEARADIDHALAIYPAYADALVERGAMKYEGGDNAGARADWQLVLKTAPNTPAGDTARRYMADIDAPAAAKP